MYRIKHVPGKQTIQFVPGSLQINDWLTSKKELKLQELPAVSQEEKD